MKHLGRGTAAFVMAVSVVSCSGAGSKDAAASPPASPSATSTPVFGTVVMSSSEPGLWLATSDGPLAPGNSCEQEADTAVGQLPGEPPAARTFPLTAQVVVHDGAGRLIAAGGLKTPKEGSVISPSPHHFECSWDWSLTVPSGDGYVFSFPGAQSVSIAGRKLLAQVTLDIGGGTGFVPSH